MNYHIDVITHGTAFSEPVGGTGGDTNGLFRARTWRVHLTEGDVNHYAISLPPIKQVHFPRRSVKVFFGLRITSPSTVQSSALAPQTSFLAVFGRNSPSVHLQRSHCRLIGIKIKKKRNQFD